MGKALPGTGAQDDDFRRKFSQKAEVLRFEVEKIVGAPWADDLFGENDTAFPVDDLADSDLTLIITLNGMAFTAIVEYEFHLSTIPYSNP